MCHNLDAPAAGTISLFRGSEEVVLPFVASPRPHHNARRRRLIMLATSLRFGEPGEAPSLGDSPRHEARFLFRRGRGIPRQVTTADSRRAVSEQPGWQLYREYPT